MMVYFLWLFKEYNYNVCICSCCLTVLIIMMTNIKLPLHVSLNYLLCPCMFFVTYFGTAIRILWRCVYNMLNGMINSCDAFKCDYVFQKWHFHVAIGSNEALKTYRTCKFLHNKMTQCDNSLFCRVQYVC